jgi:hypothetical protein
MLAMQHDQPRATPATNLLVGLVNVRNGHDGQVAIVTRITESDAGTGLEPEVFNLLSVDIERDGHAEEQAIDKAVGLDDAAKLVNTTPSMR